MKNLTTYLTHNRSFNSWNGQSIYGRIGFCHNILQTINPKIKKMDMLRFCINSKETDGYTPVVLYKNEFWQWDIPVLGLIMPERSSIHFFAIEEYIISKIICRLKQKRYKKLPEKLTLWIKFEVMN